jgi:hypothetical protein
MVITFSTHICTPWGSDYAGIRVGRWDVISAIKTRSSQVFYVDVWYDRLNNRESPSRITGRVRYELGLPSRLLLSRTDHGKHESYGAVRKKRPQSDSDSRIFWTDERSPLQTKSLDGQVFSCFPLQRGYESLGVSEAPTGDTRCERSRMTGIRGTASNSTGRWARPRPRDLLGIGPAFKLGSRDGGIRLLR